MTSKPAGDAVAKYERLRDTLEACAWADGNDNEDGDGRYRGIARKALDTFVLAALARVDSSLVIADDWRDGLIEACPNCDTLSSNPADYCPTHRLLLGGPAQVEARLRRLVDTPDSEPSAEANAWQPIETAPKDGTDVLIFADGQIYAASWVAYFDLSDQWDEEEGQWAWRGAWTDYRVVSFGYEEVAEYHPSYWMPLPAAPVPATEGEMSDG